MNTDYRPTNSSVFRLRAAKLGELVSVRSLAALSLTVALIALLATLATLLAPPLQAQSLTSFVDNSNLVPGTSSDDFQAQSFETGANEGGYTISQVNILLGDVSGKSTSVSIKEDNGGEPGNLVTPLANPASLTADFFNIFTAPAGTTLAASTTYWLTMNEGISSNRAEVWSTSSNNENGETGWTIGDGGLDRTSEMDSWSNSTNSLMMKIWGTISADAKLTALALEGAPGGEAIPLDTTFASEGYTYAAVVVNRIDAVKLTATKNDDNAMVVITNDDDQTGSPEEALLDLIVGSNTLTVTVTAQDGNATRTYTVTVERHTADTLVSNTHLSTVLWRDNFLAQSFETDSNLDGYTVSEVDIRFGETSDRSTSVKIRKNNADNEPGDLVATLANPGTLTADSLNTFTAPAGTTLAANTTYWLTVNEGISSNRAEFALTNSDDETGETGWSIGDSSLNRNSETASWGGIDTSLLITIKGTAIPTATVVSNTHLSGTESGNGFEAQSFETGANLDGYTVSEVDIRFGETSGRSTNVKIRENNADNQPGDLVATLTNPGTLTADSLNTFTPPAGTTLAASTTYWLTVNEGVSRNRADIRLNDANAETGETGWSIGDGRLSRSHETNSWSTSTFSLLITIKGTVVPCDRIGCATGRPTISGVPQVDMILTADTSAIDDADGLPATFTYQWVRIAPDSTENNVGTDSTHTVSSSDVDSTIRVDVSFTDLADNSEGPLPSVATAAVVPAAGPCPADNNWCTTMTVGIYESFGTYYGFSVPFFVTVHV